MTAPAMTAERALDVLDADIERQRIGVAAGRCCPDAMAEFEEARDFFAAMVERERAITAFRAELVRAMRVADKSAKIDRQRVAGRAVLNHLAVLTPGAPAMTTPTTPMTADDVLAVMKQGERMMPLGTSVRAAWIKSSAEARAAVTAVYAERGALLSALTMGAELNTPDFMDWIAARLVNVHGENPNVDYVVSLRRRAQACREAIARSKGGAS